MNFRDLGKLRDMDKDDILEMLGLETKQSTGGWLAGALGTFGIGMLVGAGVALMLTPKTGRELREDLRERLRRAPEEMADAVEGMGIGREDRNIGTPSKSY